VAAKGVCHACRACRGRGCSRGQPRKHVCVRACSAWCCSLAVMHGSPADGPAGAQARRRWPQAAAAPFSTLPRPTSAPGSPPQGAPTESGVAGVAGACAASGKRRPCARQPSSQSSPTACWPPRAGGAAAPTPAEPTTTCVTQRSWASCARRGLGVRGQGGVGLAAPALHLQTAGACCACIGRPAPRLVRLCAEGGMGTHVNTLAASGAADRCACGGAQACRTSAQRVSRCHQLPPQDSQPRCCCQGG